MQKIITSLPVIFLKQGECRFSTAPELVLTILGSCVAIIMYSTDRRISGIAHCVLPSFHQYEKGEGNKYRYVDTTIESMLQYFSSRKIKSSELSIKIFGGAEQLAREKRESLSIGKQNVERAVSICKEENLNIVAMDVGGFGGRKIYLSSQSGEVLLSRLESIKIVRLNELHEKNKSFNS